MKGLSKVLGAAFLVGGLALIVAVFFLFLKECQPENLFYLNMAVCCLMYIISFVTMYDIVGSVAGDDTILLVVRSDDVAHEVARELKEAFSIK